MTVAIDEAFGRFVVGPLETVLFWDVAFWTETYTVPVVVLWLILGAVFFTLKMRFVNLRAFWHAVAVTFGRYDNPDDPGEVSHFQALNSALSATVGLGNIAGVAIAVSVGGPGATFWMIVAGFLGMSTKFAEVTLALQFRRVRKDGHMMGGAMYYLGEGLGQLGWPKVGKVLAVMFAVFCIGGSLGGGNSFQVSQSLGAVRQMVPFFDQHPWSYGLVMTGLVGLVIFGGIKRIASTASKIVPLMGSVYLAMCAFILVVQFDAIPAAVSAIVRGAFTPDAAFGGALGVLILGFQRAVFSSEAGVGSAPIAHSAAKTDHPVREGIVALLEPFLDTVVICTMTALVIVITGAYADPLYADLIRGREGAALTSRALAQMVWWFPWVLSVAVILFAYSTMIAWSYYGERCWTWLFGEKTSSIYRVVFLTFVFLGSIITAGNILSFGDLMILAMAFPNIIGVALLSGRVKGELDTYLATLRAGGFQTHTLRERREARRTAQEGSMDPRS
jgi:alanine or glycine:cation symporter, AGCS family